MTYLTQAIVLRKDHLSENDRRYIIYTSQYGKINAIIKGAKKLTSKLNSHLDYFCISNLMLAKGMHFERVASARLAHKFPTVASNFIKSSSAFYFCEVVDALIKYSLKDYGSYCVLVDFYKQLEDSQDKKEVLINLNKSIFELLKCLGYQPVVVAKNQRQLFVDLNNLVQETAEKEIKSFKYLAKILA